MEWFKGLCMIEARGGYIPCILHIQLNARDGLQRRLMTGQPRNAALRLRNTLHFQQMFNFGWTSPFKEQQPCGCGTFSIRRASLFSVCSHETSFSHCVFAQISSTKPTVDHIHRVRVSSPDSYLCVILRGGNKPVWMNLMKRWSIGWRGGAVCTHKHTETVDQLLLLLTY